MNQNRDYISNRKHLSVSFDKNSDYNLTGNIMYSFLRMVIYYEFLSLNMDEENIFYVI